MSHPFGDLLTQYLHRKHGLSQAKLAAGILQSPSIITDMSQGRRLSGPQARERVVAISGWLHQQGVLAELVDANALFNAAGMSPLNAQAADEAILIRKLFAQTSPQPDQEALAPPPLLRTAYTTPRHNLPTHLTPFIGRSEQISQLVEQLQTHRLLTLTGTGGVGKTRLALQVATQMLDRVADGVWFVDLAPLSDPQAAIQRILDLFRLPEQPDRSPLASLTAYLSSKEMLLILDNCEHLIASCAELAEAILQSCPQIALLATSREALNIGGETPWRVPSLTRPLVNRHQNRSSEPAQPQLIKEDLLRFEAVALFVARARTFQPNFVFTADNTQAVAHICSQLDGIPLALEMAAARLNLFTVEELATRLDGAFDARFQLLTSGARTAPLRQQTLRATLEWSYDLLTAQEQCLLVCLSVFSGGWSFGAAEEVTGCSLDLMAQLVNKSLVIADQQTGQTRYRLLETVRQFAAEQAQRDEEEQRQTQTQHSRYYLALLTEQGQQLESQQQRTALHVIRTDFENINVAWRWAVQHHEFALLDPAIHPLFLYCEVRGYFSEGVTLFSAAATEVGVALTRSSTDQAILLPLCAKLQVRLGACEIQVSHYASGEQHLHDGLQCATLDRERAFALVYLGCAATERGELALSRTHLQKSLTISQQCKDEAGMAYALFFLQNGVSDLVGTCRLCAESLALWRRVGRPDRIADVLGMLAWNTFCLGDTAKANAYWQEDLELCEEFDLPREKAWVLDCLGFVAWCQGELVAAEQYFQEALTIYNALGRQFMVGMCMAELALVFSSRGQKEQAIALARQAVAITRGINGQMMLTMSLNYLGAVLIVAGDFVEARLALHEAIQRSWEHQFFYNLVNGFYYFAELLVYEDNSTQPPLATDHKQFALELLSCVRTQPATWQIFKDKSAQLQSEIEGALPAEVCAAAIARGQSVTLEAMVSRVLRAAEVR